MESEPVPVDLYREEILRARAMSPEEKFLAGGELFETACTLMAAGIQSEHPTAGAAEVERLLTERLTLIRRLEAGS